MRVPSGDQRGMLESAAPDRGRVCLPSIPVSQIVPRGLSVFTSILIRTYAMLRPSGEICGSAAHCRSKTSMGLRTDLAVSVLPEAAGSARATVAAADSSNPSSSAGPTAAPLCAARRCTRSSTAGRPRDPAIALMLIHDPHGLHECMTNSRTDKTEPLLLQ